jgi:hypothetical protein
MDIVFMYSTDSDRDALLRKIENSGWAEEVEIVKSARRISIDVLSGMEDEAEAFAISERFRGRKVVIND